MSRRNNCFCTYFATYLLLFSNQIFPDATKIPWFSAKIFKLPDYSLTRTTSLIFLDFQALVGSQNTVSTYYRFNKNKIQAYMKLFQQEDWTYTPAKQKIDILKDFYWQIVQYSSIRSTRFL